MNDKKIDITVYGIQTITEDRFGDEIYSDDEILYFCEKARNAKVISLSQNYHFKRFQKITRVVRGVPFNGSII